MRIGTRLVLLILFSLPLFSQYGIARKLLTGNGLPPSASCLITADVGNVWVRKDATSSSTAFYMCVPTGVFTYAWVLQGSGGGGAGTVTSVGFTGGLISVANPTTTPAFTVAGTSGGVPYFSGASTWASSAALTANMPVIGGGAGAAPSVGTRSGNTTAFVTTTGAQTSGRCVEIDASGNHIASSGACGGGGGGSVNSVTAGPSGAITVDNTTPSTPIVDIDTVYVPGKSTANAWTGDNDFAGANTTKPIKTGTSLPATCAVGEFFWQSNSMMWNCVATNIWKPTASGAETVFFQNDDFCASGASDYKLGWAVVGNIDGGQPGGEVGHPCAPAFNVSGADTPMGVTMRFGITDNTNPFGQLDGLESVAYQEYVFIFKTSAITEATYRVGLTSSATEPLPTNGIFAQFSNNTGCGTPATDTNWQYSTRAAGTSTTLAGPVVAGSTWYKLRIRSIVAGTFLMSISTSGGAYSAEQSFSTNVPTSTLAPQIIAFSCDGSTLYMLPDYFSATIVGLAR